MILPIEIDTALDEMASAFARVALIQRWQGVSEDDLRQQFEASVSAPASCDIPPDVAAAIKRRAYEKLGPKLDEIWAHVIIPENDTIH